MFGIVLRAQQTLFFAGKSVAEARPGAQPVATAQPVAAAQPSYAKTMIGDMAPPIKYNCPRCKAPLEAAYFSKSFEPSHTNAKVGRNDAAACTCVTFCPKFARMG